MDGKRYTVKNLMIQEMLYQKLYKTQNRIWETIRITNSAERYGSLQIALIYNKGFDIPDIDALFIIHLSKLFKSHKSEN